MRFGIGLGSDLDPNRDRVGPTVTTKTLAANGTSLTVVFSEAVQTFAAGANGFTVTPSGSAATLAYASGTGTSTVVFTVSRAILSAETITLTYTPGTIQDAAGNALAGFSGSSITNNSTQTAPTVSTKTIATNGTDLTVVFDAAVTGFSSGAEGFALTGLTGGATTLAYASGNGTTTVVFTISRTVAQSETSGVLAYTAGDITKVSNGAPLANFSASAVTNSSTQTAPVVSAKTVQAAGTSLVVVFDQSVTGFSSGAEGFALTALTGGATTLTYSSGNGTASITFTISRTVAQSETSGVLAYTAGDITSTNTLALANFSGSAVTNSSTQAAATYTSATVQANGTSLNVVYSAAVTGFSSGAEGYALTSLSGGATTLTYASGNASTTIVFTISRTVYSGETGGKLAYTPGDITTVSNTLAVASVANQDVTNSSTQLSATVAFDAAGNSGVQSLSSSYSWSHTCTGTNRFLAVDVSLLTAGQTVTGITYNGVALSFIGARDTVTSFGRVECWGLAAPASGANTIAVTLSGAITSVGEAVSYTGVHQTVPTEAFNSNQATNAGSATDATVAVTTVTDNAWVHAACAATDDSITAGQTTRNNVANGISSAGADEDFGPQTPAGAKTMNYTGMGTLTTWVIGGYGIKPL